MNATEFKSQWSGLAGPIKDRWPLLTEQDLEAVDGQLDELCRRIRDRYAISEGEARRQFAMFAAGPAADALGSRPSGARQDKGELT
jgi:uncharacterized protein YjbJ (UPF0337 family)